MRGEGACESSFGFTLYSGPPFFVEPNQSGFCHLSLSSVSGCHQLTTSPICCCLDAPSFPAGTARSLSIRKFFALDQAQHDGSMSSLQVLNVASCFPSGQRTQERSRPSSSLLHPTNTYVQPLGGSICTHTTYINSKHYACEPDRPKTVPCTCRSRNPCPSSLLPTAVRPLPPAGKW